MQPLISPSLAASSEALRTLEELGRITSTFGLPTYIVDTNKQLTDCIRAASEPLRRLSEGFAREQAYVSELMNLTAGWTEQFRALQQSAALQSLFSGFDENRKLIESLARDWSTSPAARALEQIQSFRMPEIDWEQLWTRHERALSFASANGWFVQPEHEAGMAFLIEECNEDAEQLDVLFVEAIAGVLDGMSARVTKEYPSRGHLVDEAFALYREGRYIAAIPLMLLVADGIAHEKSGKSAFTKKGGNTTTLAEWLERRDVEPWMRPYANQLARAHLLSRSRHGRLSRHDVLHGINVEYATKENCLRAASFLGFVAWLMAEEREAETVVE